MGISDLLFPEKCVNCGAFGSYLCEPCLKKSKQSLQYCPQCNKASVDGMTHASCLKSHSLNGAYSIWLYQGPIRQAILSFKYKFAKEIAKNLAGHTALHLKKVSIFPKDSLLIPIPLYWLRGNWRGFNQSEEIGRILARRMSWQFKSDLLIRKKSKRPQTELKGKQRRQNVRGVFSLNPNYKSQMTNDKSFILFDDVWTTGATMKEAAKTLKRSGVKRAWGLTITRS